MQPSQPHLENILQSIMQCMQQNDFARADFLLGPIRDTADARVHYFTGAVAQSRGKQQEAIAAFSRAAELNNFNHELTADCIFKLISFGVCDIAEKLNDLAIEKTPHYFGFHYCSGLIHLHRNALDLAIVKFQAVEKLKPDLLECHILSAQTLQLLGRLSDSEDSLLKALKLAPNDPRLHLNLAALLIECTSYDGAYEHAKIAVSLDGNSAFAWAMLSTAARELKLLEQALKSAEQACYLAPEDAECRRCRGTILKELGQLRKAADDFDFATSKRYQANLGNQSNLKEHRFLSRAKIEHDIEQFDYLDKLYSHQNFSNLAVQYRSVLNRLPANERTAVMPIPNDVYESMQLHYNRLLHLKPSNYTGAALSTSLNTNEVETDYFSREPGITWIDDLLSPDALDALRRYCLESTIWFDFNHPNGYLGAIFEAGFTDPLLLQICDELKIKFPRIFGNHPLMQMWAFKYDSQLQGIQLHGDVAAINLNFWITPDDANLDESSGGLRIWDKAAPTDWSFKEFNSGTEKAQARIHQFLSENNANEIVVPYRQNRAVVFNSDLFHATDQFHFKDGYENRRINITMLFGSRNGHT